MSEPNVTDLVDIQASRDTRNIDIDMVGVRRVKYPMSLLVKGGGNQHTVGIFGLTVDLPREFKGTHMSRFMEVLGDYNGDLSSETIPLVLQKLRDILKADTSYLEVYFTYFMEKAAPVTGKKAMMGYECAFHAAGGKHQKFEIEVKVPVTTLCPCSKEISDRGAHNQRGYVTVRVTPAPGEILWIEDLIELIERSGSAPLYPLLKRPDEKFVTEQAYDNPRFVEDMVREVGMAFDAESRILGYLIEVENHESIHDHNAYAMIQRRK